AYVSARFSGVFVCAVDPVDGSPMPLQTSAIGNTEAINIVTDPSQRFVYVTSTDGSIETYPIDAHGNLPSTPSSSILDSVGVGAIEPRGHFLYAIGFGFLQAYEIDATSGALSSAGIPQVMVGSPSNFDTADFSAIDPTGTFLYISLGIGQG